MDDVSGKQNPPNAAGEGAPENGTDNGGEPAEGAGEGADVSQRLAHAESLISDLKQTAGVKSVRELKAKLAPPKEPAQPKAPEKAEGNADYLEMRLQGYTPDEISIAKRLAGDKPLVEAVKDPTVKAAIDGVRAANKTAGAIPEPSNRAPLVNNKRFNELSPAEKRAHYAGTIDHMTNQAKQKSRTNS